MDFKSIVVYLFVTEDGSKETPLEESLWVQAAEKADSLGVDIINTSLGYNEFDESKYNYTYEDMDGTTTFITRGATIAAEKGMLLINSMGNSGEGSWRFLGAPADAKNILSVGAVDSDENIASFSSFGPTYDGRIKPETLAQGLHVNVIDENDEIVVSSGTSFSSPLIAGVAACLWQAYPNKTNLEIRNLIIENSNRFNNPTEQYGYGLLNVSKLALDKKNDSFSYDIQYTSTSIEFISNIGSFEKIEVELYHADGRLIKKQSITAFNSIINIANLASGIYFLQYSSLTKTEVTAFYK